MDVTYRHWEGPIAAAQMLLAELCAGIFDSFDPAYLTDRLPSLVDPDLWLAEAEGAPIGFKLGYRRGPDLLYSWLGGVSPAARGQGVASALMVRQHEAARAAGYAHVETRTRAPNNAMIIANLRHGFHVCGFEIDARGIAVVIQRKDLG